MINRILIRIKVVQILYSYLLSRNEFKIDTPPADATRERRFAYSVYLDMLLLVQELSGVRTNVSGRPAVTVSAHPKMRQNRVAAALAASPELKELTFKNPNHLSSLAHSLQAVADRLSESAAFTDYSRRRVLNLEIDVNLWAVLIETMLLKDPDLIAALRQDPDFSLAGFHHGVQQAISTLRSYNDSRAMYLKAQKDLEESLAKAADLYYGLFTLIVELTDYETERLEAAKNKYLATVHDLNPNTRFINNRFAAVLAENQQLLSYREKRPHTWADQPVLLKSLLEGITASETYNKYMDRPETDWKTDCEFWRDVVKSIILPSDALAEALEAKSVFWNDDLPTIGTFVLKTIRKFAASTHGGSDVLFMPSFKDSEDEAFGVQLFMAAVENRETYRGYIDQFLSSDWDPERLAFMDIVIMISALAEMLNFPGIPVPVTMNEYIEIANCYSTHRSGPFVNGLLYSVASKLAADGLLKKPLVCDNTSTDK